MEDHDVFDDGFDDIFKDMDLAEAEEIERNRKEEIIRHNHIQNKITRYEEELEVYKKASINLMNRVQRKEKIILQLKNTM